MQTQRQGEKKKANGKHRGEFGKRMPWENSKQEYTPPTEEYINSALGSSLGHQYSISRGGRHGRLEE